MDVWPSHPNVGFLQTVATKLKAYHCLECIYGFASLELKVIAQTCSILQASLFTKTWIAKFGEGELFWPTQSPSLNQTDHVWDESEHWLCDRHYCPTVPDFSNAFMFEWANSQNHAHKCSGISSHKSVDFLTANGSWIWNWMYNKHMAMMFRCPQTFANIVHLLYDNMSITVYEYIWVKR